jgi:hypothetical protein
MPRRYSAAVLAEARPREPRTSKAGIKELIVVKAVWLVAVDASMRESPWAESRRSLSLIQLVYVAGRVEGDKQHISCSGVEWLQWLQDRRHKTR